jgi:hypothetical protein
MVQWQHTFRLWEELANCEFNIINNQTKTFNKVNANVQSEHLQEKWAPLLNYEGLDQSKIHIVER